MRHWDRAVLQAISHSTKPCAAAFTSLPRHATSVCSAVTGDGAHVCPWVSLSAWDRPFPPSLPPPQYPSKRLYDRCAPLFLNVNSCTDVQIQCSCYRMNKSFILMMSACCLLLGAGGLCVPTRRAAVPPPSAQVMH